MFYVRVQRIYVVSTQLLERKKERKGGRGEREERERERERVLANQSVSSILV